MPLEAREKEIHGKTWSATLLPATVALEVAATLAKVALPAIGKGLAALRGEAGLGALDAEALPALGQALSELGKSVGDPEIRALIKRVVVRKPDGSEGSVHCDSVQVTAKNFDALFAGAIAMLLEVAAWIIEDNTAIPFASLPSIVRRALDGARMAPTSPPSVSSAPSAAAT